MSIRIVGCLLSVLLVFACAPACADYPEQAVSYIIPFAPGGESDITARLQQPVFEQLTGQSLVIQYMPGRGGANAWERLNRLPGNGRIIMGVNLPHIILEPLQGNVRFTTEEIASVYFYHYTPDAIVVAANSPWHSLDELIQAALTKPGILRFAGSGVFTANHIAQARFDQLAGIASQYVPFKGTSAAVTALLGKQVQAQWGYPTVAVEYAAQVRLLAIASEQRLPRFPEIPTLRELGYDLISGAYRGIAVPAATPEAIRKKLSDIIAAINHDAGFRQAMEDAGFALIDVPYSEVDAFMKQRRQEYELEIKRIGLSE